MTLKSYRDLDNLLLEVDASFLKMIEEFERTLMGKRVEQPFEEDDDGSEEGQDNEIPDDSPEDDNQGNQDDYSAPGGQPVQPGPKV